MSQPPFTGSGAVRVRVLAKGHDRIFTGEFDASARIFTRHAEGTEFDLAPDIADALADRGFVEKLDAVAAAPSPPSPQMRPSIPGDAEERELWSRLAQERLAFRSRRDPDTGCVVWKGAKTAGGYGGLTFLGKVYTVHRLSWLAHKGAIPPELRVCHSCDNRLCLAIEHLFLGTARQNVVDMWRKGRGRGFGVVRLNEAAVAQIKRRLNDGESVAALAGAMNVSLNTIGDIKRGRTWRFVNPAPAGERA